VLDGEILGSFVRRPARGEHRANLHSGGSAHRSPVRPQDRALVAKIQPLLRPLGLDFVGLDLIGEYLIEVNVTSPMGLNEMNQTGFRRTEAQLVDFLEKRVKKFPAKS
jgi:Glutathione synthase/Ribosomal protein S6 modification enzyme (glutaminyl transferase)